MKGMVITMKYPTIINSGLQMKCGHCQGIATDGEFMYYSFTTKLVKTDLAGNYIGSADGLTGHLGCIAYDEATRSVIGSLEYKDDQIGQGILKGLGKSEEPNPGTFYIAKFDAAKITSPDLSAADGIMTVVKLDDVCEDYLYNENGVSHRFGCSGIDGITIVPDFEGHRSIFVAYGIYGDNSRSDNDDQVLLCLNAGKIEDKFAPLSENGSGVRGEKYFVHTGNTTWGIQNLEYDPYTDCLMAAVYRGCKPEFPNYPMFFIDLRRQFIDDGRKSFPLCERGETHKSGIRGSYFGYGSTGMIALGGGEYYFSHDGRKDGGYFTEVRLYRASGDSDFSLVQNI